MRGSTTRCGNAWCNGSTKPAQSNNEATACAPTMQTDHPSEVLSGRTFRLGRNCLGSNPGGWTISVNGEAVRIHSAARPSFFAGSANPFISFSRGYGVVVTTAHCPCAVRGSIPRSLAISWVVRLAAMAPVLHTGITGVRVPHGLPFHCSLMSK